MSTRWSTTTKRVVVGAALALGALVLVRAHDVVEPFLWALIFAYVFAPPVGAVQRRTGVRRGFVVTGLYVALALALYGIGRILVPLIFEELTEVRRTLPALLNNVQQQVVAALAGSGFEPLATTIIDNAQALTQRLSGMVLPVAIGVLSTVLKVLVFVIALFYLLRDGPGMAEGVRGLLPPGHRDELLRVFRRINVVLGQYLRGQVVLIAIMATVTTVGLAFLQVPFSLLLGFLTGVLETIPFVGPITAGTIAVLVALGHPAPFGWTQVGYAGVVAAMYTILRYAEDYVVIPQIIGRVVELHPLVVIFALLTGGAIGGLLGILVAVPVAASLRIAFLFALAKLRDEDPYRVLSEAVPVQEEAPGPPRRPA
jgi:predicted PurR-regulated permease PerM